MWDRGTTKNTNKGLFDAFSSGEVYPDNNVV